MNTSAPLANLITLGARDLPVLREFYRSLGWPQVLDDGDFVPSSYAASCWPCSRCQARQ